jgi:hypothetical protein
MRSRPSSVEDEQLLVAPEGVDVPGGLDQMLVHHHPRLRRRIQSHPSQDLLMVRRGPTGDHQIVRGEADISVDGRADAVVTGAGPGPDFPPTRSGTFGVKTDPDAAAVPEGSGQTSFSR